MEHSLRRREVGDILAPRSFAAKHFEEALDRTPAAAHAAPLRIGGNQRVTHLGQLTGLKAHTDLRFVSRRLVVVCRGQY